MLESRGRSENLGTRVIYAEGDQNGSLKQHVDEIVLFEKLRYGGMFVFRGRPPSAIRFSWTTRCLGRGSRRHD